MFCIGRGCEMNDVSGGLGNRHGIYLKPLTRDWEGCHSFGSESQPKVNRRFTPSMPGVIKKDPAICWVFFNGGSGGI